MIPSLAPSCPPILGLPHTSRLECGSLEGGRQGANVMGLRTDQVFGKRAYSGLGNLSGLRRKWDQDVGRVCLKGSLDLFRVLAVDLFEAGVVYLDGQAFINLEPVLERDNAVAVAAGE